MSFENEIRSFLQRHLQSILESDLETYHATTAEDLTLYEWWVTPHRIDGLPFHDFMTESNARRGTVFGAQDAVEAAPTRFDLANLHIQHYGDTAIASYTLLISTATPEGVRVAAHNESRVMVRTVFVFVGMAVYLATNTAFSMLALSHRYAAAATAAEQSIVLAAGQAMIALSEGTGGYVGMPLAWLAGIILSALMLRGRVSAGRPPGWAWWGWGSCWRVCPSPATRPPARRQPLRARSSP